MPRRPRARAKPPTQIPRVAELEARVVALEEVLDRYHVLFFGERNLPAELETCHRLAMEAVAQAQDALSTSSPLEARINHLTLAVAEGIQHVDRAERRIAGVVARSRKLLRESGLESPGLEAEAHDLRLLNGGGGEAEGVPPVSEVVADPSSDALVDKLRSIGLSR